MVQDPSTFNFQKSQINSRQNRNILNSLVCNYLFINNNFFLMGCGAVQNTQTSQLVPRSSNSFSQLDKRNQSTYKKQPKDNLEKSYLQKSQPKQTMNHAYEVKQLLGKGTYGQVYRCIKNQTGEQFALKIVKINAKSKQQAKRHIDSLKSQISVLKKLNHPNIVKYHCFDISPDNQTVEIVFQLIQNGSLKDVIERCGPLSEGQASKICRQILQALDYLHEKSIIHRDLKCANILVTKDGIAKITDFGTAKQVKIKTNEDIAKLCASLKGTPYYMAPQILKRSGHHKGADIWSFGCTLIQMLTGKAPWTTLTDKFQQVISYIMSGIHPPLPPDITKQCEFFLQSCLDVVPSQRLTARQLLNHRFILMNAKNSSPSLVYEKLSPRNQTRSLISSKTKKRREQIQITELDPVSITKRKRSQTYQLPEERPFSNYNNDLSNNSMRNKVQMGIKSNSNMALMSPKYNNQRSQQFLNYYSGVENKQVDVSEPYVPIKKQSRRVSRKKEVHDLKKVAKTAGHVRMTEDNLLDWNQIEQQVMSKEKMHNYKMSDQQINFGGIKTLQNTNKLRSNTQLTEVDEEPDEIINTTLAKQQRERYVNNQMQERQRKQKQRQKWQEQLKKQSEKARIQLSQRYLYGRT